MVGERQQAGMATFERRSRIRAPLEAVWAFHSGVGGLTAVTPGWMNLRVESVRGPGGEADPAVLEAGAEVSLSMRPFGVGRRQRWTSRIVERERRDRAAWFVDEMVEGPFPHWRHTHRFRAAGDATELLDRIEYRLPLVPGLLSALAWPGFEALFAFRHRRTRRLITDARS